MKQVPVTIWIFLFMPLYIGAGCKQPGTLNQNPVKTDNDKITHYTNYSPVKIDIMPLTEFVSPGDTQQPKINIYVSLIDQFGSQIKSPGMFRFELYEYMQRSSEPKGKRAVIWPDVDLTEPAANNDYWRDFLRAYEFSLPCEQTGSQEYILQVTCLCPNGKRLSSEFPLKKTK